MCKMSRAAFPYNKRDDMILPMNMGGLENRGLAYCQHGGDVFFFPGVCMSKPGLGYADGRAGSKAAAVYSRLNHAIRTSGHGQQAPPTPCQAAGCILLGAKQRVLGDRGVTGMTSLRQHSPVHGYCGSSYLGCCFGVQLGPHVSRSPSSWHGSRFFRGEWAPLLHAAMSEAGAVGRSTSTSPDSPSRRAERAIQYVHLGELSAAHQDQDTLRQLTDPSRRPFEPYGPLGSEILDFQPDAPVALDTVAGQPCHVSRHHSHMIHLDLLA